MEGVGVVFTDFIDSLVVTIYFAHTQICGDPDSFPDFFTHGMAQGSVTQMRRL